MNELENIPDFVEEAFQSVKIKLMVQMIFDAGLTEEFEKFIDSDANQWVAVDKYFEQFAKLYPDKFFIVPEEERYTKTYMIEND